MFIGTTPKKSRKIVNVSRFHLATHMFLFFIKNHLNEMAQNHQNVSLIGISCSLHFLLHQSHPSSSKTPIAKTPAVCLLMKNMHIEAYFLGHPRVSWCCVHPMCSWTPSLILLFSYDKYENTSTKKIER